MLRPVEHGVLRSVVVGHPNLPSSYAFTKPLMIPIANISMTNQAPISLQPAKELEANMVFSQEVSLDVLRHKPEVEQFAKPAELTAGELTFVDEGTVQRGPTIRPPR